MTSTMTTCLWYDGMAEEAAEYYVSLFPDSHIDKKVKAPADNPSAQEGQLLVVEFTLFGQKFVGLNGGPHFKFNEAVSFQIGTDDQAETDRLWDALTANGGQESQCGWLKDRWGVSWQITPKRMTEFLSHDDPEVAKRAFQAMMQMTKLDIATLERAAAGETINA